MKNFRQIWKDTFKAGKITANDYVTRAILIAMTSKSNTPKQDIVVALLQKYFSPVTNKTKLNNGAHPYFTISAYAGNTYYKTIHNKQVRWPWGARDILGYDANEFFDNEDEAAEFLMLASNIRVDKIGRKYVYYFTRQDIEPVHQAVQAAHALLGLGTMVKNVDPFNIYFQWIGVKDAQELKQITQKHKHKSFTFIEPDLGNTITSVAFEPVLWNKRDEFLDYKLLSMDH